MYVCVCIYIYVYLFTGMFVAWDQDSSSTEGVGVLADVLKHHRALLQLALGNNHVSAPLGLQNEPEHRASGYSM